MKHLDVIGILEDNNLIVSRASLEKFEVDTDKELSYYKMRMNKLESENRKLTDENKDLKNALELACSDMLDESEVVYEDDLERHYDLHSNIEYYKAFGRRSK